MQIKLKLLSLHFSVLISDQITDLRQSRRFTGRRFFEDVVAPALHLCTKMAAFSHVKKEKQLEESSNRTSFLISSHLARHRLTGSDRQITDLRTST